MGLDIFWERWQGKVVKGNPLFDSKQWFRQVFELKVTDSESYSILGWCLLSHGILRVTS